MNDEIPQCQFGFTPAYGDTELRLKLNKEQLEICNSHEKLLLEKGKLIKKLAYQMEQKWMEDPKTEGNDGLIKKTLTDGYRTQIYLGNYIDGQVVGL